MLLALVLLPFAAAGAMLLLAVLFVLAAVLVTLFFVPIITGCMALVCLIATPFAFVFAAPSMGLVCLFLTLIGIGFTLATFGLLILLLKAVFAQPGAYWAGAKTAARILHSKSRREITMSKLKAVILLGVVLLIVGVLGATICFPLAVNDGIEMVNDVLAEEDMVKRQQIGTS